MEKKGANAGIVTRSKSQRGKKIPEPSASRSRRVSKPGRSKRKSVPVPSVSSDSCSPDEDYVEFLKTYKPHDGYSSDEIDSDYAEFLKTYDPQESYPGASSPDGVEVQNTGSSKEKGMPAVLKVATDSDS
jgi:hypothetical protein